MRSKKRKTNPDVLKAMRKYIHSEKGKATRKAYFENHKQDMLMYHRGYNRFRRVEAKKKKICMRCLKNKVMAGYVQCEKCSTHLAASRFFNRLKRNS
jgi:hypothetical protein